LVPAVSKAITSIGAWIVANTALEASIWTLIASVAVLTGGLFIIVGAIGAVSSGALSAKSDVDKLTESLRQFNDVAGTADGTSISGPSRYGGGTSLGGSGGRSVVYNVSGSSDADDTGSYLSWHDRRASGDRA